MDDEDIYVVIIINSIYVRWEIFNITDTMEDLYNLLENKYNTGKSIIEIGDIYFSKSLKANLYDIAINKSITAKVSTKNKSYILLKDID
jgi:hypothetical protein